MMTTRSAGRRRIAGRHCVGRKVHLATVCVLLAAGVNAAGQAAARPQRLSPEDRVIAAETAFQKQSAALNIAAVKEMLLPDFIEADKAVLNRDELLRLLEQAGSLPCRFGASSVEHPIVTFLDPDIATIAYHSAESITCGGHVLTMEGNISTVWVRRNGEWKAKLHSEITTTARVQ